VLQAFIANSGKVLLAHSLTSDADIYNTQDGGGRSQHSPSGGIPVTSPHVTTWRGLNIAIP